MASIQNKADQLRFSGRGPLDAKARVKTYDALSLDTTWTIQVDGNDIFVAYNGMIVSVWGDTTAENNGVYYLHDSAVTTAAGKPSVEPANWHKLGESAAAWDPAAADAVTIN